MFLLANGEAADNAITIVVLCAVIVFLSIVNALLVIALNRRNTKLVNSRLETEKIPSEDMSSDGQPVNEDETTEEHNI